MSFSDNKWLWLGLATAFLAFGVIFWLLVMSQPFRLIVLFDEIGDLKAGDPVVWKGFTIGKIEEIHPLVENKIGVTIRLREDHASSITHGSEFVLKQTALLGWVGKNAIEIITPPSHGKPFANGEKVPGTVLPKASLLEDGRKWTLDSWNRLRDATSSLLEEFKTSPYRKDAEDALARLKTLAEDGATQAKEGLKQFRLDHRKDFEDIIKKLEVLRDELRKKGDERGARQLTEQIEKIKISAELPK